jgi:hypothetical protein
MTERIARELELLRKRWPDLEYVEDGQWVRLPGYPLPEGWSRPSTDVACQIPKTYPGTPPYGIYVPVGLTFKGSPPDNYTPASTKPPFPGDWGIFSWTQDAGGWHATADLTTGSNLFNFALTFAERFQQGK